MNETVIVMLSGGLDSVYLLYHYLTKTDLDVHAHHIVLKTPSEDRWEEEVKASRAVEKYCKNQYRDFQYSESYWEFPFLKYVGWDSDLCLLTASKIA